MTCNAFSHQPITSPAVDDDDDVCLGRGTESSDRPAASNDRPKVTLADMLG